MTDTSNWLQAARERCEAATKGPWTADHYGNDECVVVSEATGLPWDTISYATEANGNFIAHARTDLPLALDLLTQAAKALEAVEWVRDETWEVCPWCGALRGLGDKPYHDDDCLREVILSRIRTGGGGE